MQIVREIRLKENEVGNESPTQIEPHYLQAGRKYTILTELMAVGFKPKTMAQYRQFTHHKGETQFGKAAHLVFSSGNHGGLFLNERDLDPGSETKPFTKRVHDYSNEDSHYRALMDLHLRFANGLQLDLASNIVTQIAASRLTHLKAQHVNDKMAMAILNTPHFATKMQQSVSAAMLIYPHIQIVKSLESSIFGSRVLNPTPAIDTVASALRGMVPANAGEMEKSKTAELLVRAFGLRPNMHPELLKYYPKSENPVELDLIASHYRKP